MNNPDFANRVEQGLPLDTAPFPVEKMYTWDTTPAEGYTDIVPKGGFAIRKRRETLAKRVFNSVFTAMNNFVLYQLQQ
jgi:hypothetical protein